MAERGGLISTQELAGLLGAGDLRGLDKWKAEGRAVETGPAKGYPPATFTAKPKPGLFIDKRETQKASTNRSTVVVNALGPQFHKGLEPSRYGRPGRIPGSVNVPAA